MATYVVGDIHGCFDELQQVLNLADFNPKLDKLYCIGDLINGGPKPIEVLEFLLNLPYCLTVLGNHDLTLLGVAEGFLEIPKDRNSIGGFNEILNHNNLESILKWLKSQPLIYYDASFNVTLVHAGLDPDWTIEQALELGKEVSDIITSDQYLQLLANMYGNKPVKWSDDLQSWERYRYIINCLTRCRFFDQNRHIDFAYKGIIENAPKELLPWFKYPGRKAAEDKILFGHWSSIHGVTNEQTAVALDTGCVWGNLLTLLRLDDSKYFQVKNLNAS